MAEAKMWPKDVGILALELYFPGQYVDMTELEKYDGVSPGKYTVGLGQSRMAFCNDREDIYSLCLTVTHRLLERYNVKPQEIGRLEVGTETLLDKSKSVKSVLMQLFQSHGCTDIEGADTMNACYGGTNALFNAVNWIESSYWDGRLALVVAGDNAVYAAGSARPTGGAGAIAMLVGPNAPLTFDRGLRASCMRHNYDFYKPNLVSEYPVVNGTLSIQCYFSALEICYQLYREKAQKMNPGQSSVTLASFKAILFHCPYTKLVQKAFARLSLIDFLNTPKNQVSKKFEVAEKYRDVKLEDSYFDKDLEKLFVRLSTDDFNQKTKCSLSIPQNVGNMYTPSVYSCLVSLLVKTPLNELAGQKIGIFSYGSGSCSSMYSLTVTKDTGEGSGLLKLVNALSYVLPHLERRRKTPPSEYVEVLDKREKNCHVVPFVPQNSIADMFPGTYYLTELDKQYKRTYKRT